MDCDLQDRPEAIPQLYNKALEGFDVVFAKRVERKDSALTMALSRAFYKVYEYFTDGSYDLTLQLQYCSSRGNFSVLFNA